MNFEGLRRRVERAERLVEGRGEETRQHWTGLRQAWREGWTPWRIVIVGLGLGFIVGKTEPAAAIGSLAGKVGAAPKLLQLISALSALFTASQAQQASEHAERAADNAEEAVEQDATVPERPLPSDGRSAAYASAAPAPARRDDEAAPPRPAEAATELSER